MIYLSIDHIILYCFILWNMLSAKIYSYLQNDYYEHDDSTVKYHRRYNDICNSSITHTNVYDFISFFMKIDRQNNNTIISTFVNNISIVTTMKKINVFDTNVVYLSERKMKIVYGVFAGYTI